MTTDSQRATWVLLQVGRKEVQSAVMRNSASVRAGRTTFNFGS